MPPLAGAHNRPTPHQSSSARAGEVTFEPAVAVPGEEEVVPVSAAQLQQYLSYFGRSTVATLANATGPPWEVEALAALTPEKAARDGLFLPACGLHAENAAICSSETAIELPGGAAVDNCAVSSAAAGRGRLGGLTKGKRCSGRGTSENPGRPRGWWTRASSANCNPTCAPAWGEEDMECGTQQKQRNEGVKRGL